MVSASRPRARSIPPFACPKPRVQTSPVHEPQVPPRGGDLSTSPSRGLLAPALEPLEPGWPNHTKQARFPDDQSLPRSSQLDRRAPGEPLGSHQRSTPTVRLDARLARHADQQALTPKLLVSPLVGLPRSAMQARGGHRVVLIQVDRHAQRTRERSERVELFARVVLTRQQQIRERHLLAALARELGQLRAERGEDGIVTRRNRPVATLVPVNEISPELYQQRLKLLAELQDIGRRMEAEGGPITVEEILQWRDEGRR